VKVVDEQDTQKILKSRRWVQDIDELGGHYQKKYLKNNCSLKSIRLDKDVLERIREEKDKVNWNDIKLLRFEKQIKKYELELRTKRCETFTNYNKNYLAFNAFECLDFNFQPRNRLKQKVRLLMEFSGKNIQKERIRNLNEISMFKRTAAMGNLLR